MRQRWERDAGLRLDHLLLSPPLALRLEDAGVDRTVRGLANASDHAPVWVKLRASTKLAARKRKATDTTAASKASPELAQTIGPAADAGRMTARSRWVGAAKRMITNRPLLVIDGDSFAHRSYHALPKTIRRNDGNGAGAIVGFKFSVAALRCGATPRGHRRMGHLRGAHKTPRAISGLSERP